MMLTVTSNSVKEEQTVMKFWAKIYSDNHLLKDMVVEKNNEAMTRTRRVLSSLEDVCHDWDLAVPVWLDTNVNDFQKRSRTRFYSDNFTENISFDYMEIQIIEE